MSDTLIKLEGVSKKFCRSLKRSLWYGVQDLRNELRGRRHGGDGDLRPEEFWAVRDVTLEIRRGECLGLIGRNGAGKTTLLRMLNGLIKPDRGRIEMRGRIGALIALGAGFNPILSGRENIYVNASVLGMTKRETDAKVDEIVDFAEIGDFIDVPVQSYSSGMTVRLGFAAASVLDPDILLLDEVLAVGDASFRYKCYKRIDDLRKRSAVIFVSHDMPNVSRVCDRAILMAHGETELSGPPAEAIERYLAMNDEQASREGCVVSLFPPISAIEVSGLPERIRFNAPLRVAVTVSAEDPLAECDLYVNVTNMSGHYVASCRAASRDHRIGIAAGVNRWMIELTALPLKPGKYHVSIALAGPDRALIAIWTKGHLLEVAGGHSGNVADCQLDLSRWATV